MAATDAQRGQLVMQAGSLDRFNRPNDTTTWTWDGHNRTRLAAGAQPLMGTGMVYDPTVHAIVLYGHVRDGAGLWVWDGRAWAPVPSS